jgi:hypothetical protein
VAADNESNRCTEDSTNQQDNASKERNDATARSDDRI